MFVVADCGSRGYNCGDGVMIALVECLSSIPDLSVLKFYVFRLLLVFGSVPRSQISLSSFESELLSGILVKNWI